MVVEAPLETQMPHKKKMTFHVMHFERKGPYLGSAQEETS